MNEHDRENLMNDSESAQESFEGAEARSKQPSWFSESILRYRRVLIILTHIAVFVVSLFLAFVFAFNMDIGRRWLFGPFIVLVALAIPLKTTIFGAFGQYHGWWRYVGIPDLIQIAKASFLCSIVMMVFWLGYGWAGGHFLPRAWTAKLNSVIEPLDGFIAQVRPIERGIDYLWRKEGSTEDSLTLAEDGVTRFYGWYDKKSRELTRCRKDIAKVVSVVDTIDEELRLVNPNGGQISDKKAEEFKELSRELRDARKPISKYVTNLGGVRDLIELTQVRQIIAEAQEDGLSEEEYGVVVRKTEGLREFWLQIHGVIMLDLFTTIMLLSGVRMVTRLYHEEYFSSDKKPLKRFLIVGAGDAGEALLREMTRIRADDYVVAGFVDDDRAKHGVRIHGVSVLGRVEELPKICQEQKIDEIGIAMPSASHKQLRRVVQVCEGAKIRFRTVPSITDIASGKLRVSQIRDVDINDLLGRDVVELDLKHIRKFLNDKVIFVTGAGGSIGSEMCRQVCQFGPKLLLLVEQAENPLFFIERELRRDFGDVKMEALVCDITDRLRLEKLFAKYRPEVVIHAAAHKHVPLMETNPGEAVKNNVRGTMAVADTSDKFGVGNFVMISTDKAVNPTSIMGSTKRIAEMYIQDLNSTSKTDFVTVRFGNVLGSNGSVVPIFKKQIAAGGPVTVTHPEMRRYFMTIPEASQLVLQAATMGKGGEIFVLDMGEPVKIVDLARELITLSGFRPGEDIEIAFSGVRPGEKLFEELSIEGEDMLATNHPKIGVWKNIPKDRHTLRSEIDRLVGIAEEGDYKGIVAAVKVLIPEYLGDMNNGNCG
jgi:FlaA1/EpsC-like NDP-sugar epimerase